MNRSARFYDRICFLYPLIDVFLKPQKKNFFSHISRSRPGELLEIGVGNGAHLKYYHSHRVTGIDTSINMLKHARKHVSGDIKLFHMNGEALMFADKSFDYVTLSHVIAVVEHPEKVIAEVHRVLKPGGKVFILNHFTPGNFLGKIDKVFDKMSRLLHFRSSFNVSSFGMEGFQLLHETNVGMFSYFKMLTYEKKL